MADLEDRYSALARRLEGRPEEEWPNDPEFRALAAEAGLKQAVARVKGRLTARREQMRALVVGLEDEQKKARPDWGRVRALGEQLLAELEDDPEADQEAEQARALLEQVEELEDDQEES